MDYRDFSVEDFVLDPFFRSWVKGGAPAAARFWEDWLLANPDRVQRVEEARELVRYLDFSTDGPSAVETNAVKKAVAEKITALQSIKRGGDRRRGAGLLFIPYPLVAAIVLLLAVLGIFYLLPTSKLNVSTTYSQTKDIILPDGSLVTLNANSSVSYNRDWKENDREIWLEGEAFFDIKKKTGSPRPEFLVHAGELTVKVLGTSFNVYNREEKTAVVLQEGKVELSSPGDSRLPTKVTMRPGEKVEVAGSGYKHEQVAVDPYLSWRDHRMVFENSSLAEIARLLEDNHGYRVVFTDPRHEELRFTGSYSSERIDLFLKALSEAFDIPVTVSDKTITIQ